MRLASRFTAHSALAITLCWVGLLVLAGSTDALLFMAPALLIAVPLLGGRYVGEELIAKLVARRARRPRHLRAVPQSAPPVPVARRPRGTRLIAFSLAKRPPPSRLLWQT